MDRLISLNFQRMLMFWCPLFLDVRLRNVEIGKFFQCGMSFMPLGAERRRTQQYESALSCVFFRYFQQDTMPVRNLAAPKQAVRPTFYDDQRIACSWVLASPQVKGSGATRFQAKGLNRSQKEMLIPG